MVRVLHARQNDLWYAYDTCAAEELHRQRVVLLFTPSRDTARASSCSWPLPSDFVAALVSISIGAPADVLPSWAYVTWWLEVAGCNVFGGPMWIPPDEMLAPSEQAYLEHMAAAMTDAPKAPKAPMPEIVGLDTPVGWSFMRWMLNPGVLLEPHNDPRVVLRLTSNSPTPPVGDLRVVLRGRAIRGCGMNELATASP